MKLKKQMEDTYPPEKAKQVAFAVATQMAHKTGKSPKTFGTSEGRSEAKAKFDKPKSEYKKTASAIMFDGFSDELEKIAISFRLPSAIRNVPAVTKNLLTNAKTGLGAAKTSLGTLPRRAYTAAHSPQVQHTMYNLGDTALQLVAPH